MVANLPDYIEQLDAEGVTISYMSEEERAKWASMVPDTPARWAKDMEELGLPGWAITERFFELCEELVVNNALVISNQLFGLLGNSLSLEGLPLTSENTARRHLEMIFYRYQ